VSVFLTLLDFFDALLAGNMGRSCHFERLGPLRDRGSIPSEVPEAVKYNNRALLNDLVIPFLKKLERINAPCVMKKSGYLEQLFKLRFSEGNMNSTRFVVLLLAVAFALTITVSLASADYVVIKDKNGICSVRESTHKTPKTIAGPFKTK